MSRKSKNQEPKTEEIHIINKYVMPDDTIVFETEEFGMIVFDNRDLTEPIVKEFMELYESIPETIVNEDSPTNAVFVAHSFHLPVWLYHNSKGEPCIKAHNNDDVPLIVALLNYRTDNSKTKEDMIQVFQTKESGISIKLGKKWFKESPIKMLAVHDWNNPNKNKWA